MHPVNNSGIGSCGQVIAGVRRIRKYALGDLRPMMFQRVLNSLRRSHLVLFLLIDPFANIDIIIERNIKFGPGVSHEPFLVKLIPIDSK